MPPAKTPAKVVDFDAARKRRKGKRFKWRAYGKTWDLKRPNVAVMADLESLETTGAFINYITAHVDATQRKDFLATLAADEELDFDVLADMAKSMQEVVYADLPQSPS